MLSPETEKKIEALWDLVSSAGLAASPYVVLDQIACLIFLKHLHELDLQRSAAGTVAVSQVRVSDKAKPTTPTISLWKKTLQQEDIGVFLVDVAYPWLRKLEQRLSNEKIFGTALRLNGLMGDAYFQLDMTKNQAIQQLVQSVDELFPCPGFDHDGPQSSGEVFAKLFEQASQNSTLGQIATPPHIARFMVSLLDPAAGEKIIDPAVGTGTLLVNALGYMREGKTPSDRSLAGRSDSLTGIDLNHAQVRISWIYLLLQGIESPLCIQGNSLNMQNNASITNKILQDKYDFVLSDVPFGGRIQQVENSDANGDANIQHIELQYLSQALSLLRPNGRTALIVPQSLLTVEDTAHIRTRRTLLIGHQLEAVVLLPEEVFAPHIGIKAAILVVRKHPAQQPASARSNPELKTTTVWFYEVENDGVSDESGTTGVASPENDLLDAWMHFKLRNADLQSWEATKGRYYQAVSLQPNTKWFNPQVTHRTATQTKQWQVPVRIWLEQAEWSNAPDGVLGSHDAAGRVRSEYIEEMASRLYVADRLDKTLLAHNCIEAHGWSLELTRYKPLEKPNLLGEKSVLELINELEALERNILQHLIDLRKNLGGDR
ncbi:N-6 DNA methylase [Pseudomonas sp.]|uniref:class I SAM-dependent DNA methyltransferase n=1 Tax=Pseudomonas sp. TaxID=306 RepID=UPI003BB5773E